MPSVAQGERPHLATLLQDFQRHGAQTAVISRRGLRTESTTYQELAALAGRLARELEARDIHKGDRVAIWGENGRDWIAAFFGCMLRGVVPVPVDAAGSEDFARRVVREVDAKLVVCEQERTGKLEKATPRLAFEDFERSLPASPLLEPVAGLSEQDTLQIVFTSGTTGEPKGVVHTHGNVLASLRPIEREMRKYLKYERIFHPLRFLHTLPLSHVFGQFMGLWIPELLGAVVHFESRLVAGDLVEIIHSERIHALAAVPRVLEILASHLRQRFPGLGDRLERAHGLPVWRRWWIFRDVHRALGLRFWAAISGGATLAPEVERFWTTLGFAVIQGYGMTETAALVSLVHPFHPAAGRIGRILPGREVRLGEDGEILVRGATVATAAWEGGQLKPRASEWLATGDLGALDASGNLSFRGRKKDVIVTAAGLNIYPEDLEAALLRQPGVRAAAVVEIAGPQGPQPMAVVVMRASGGAAEAVRAANRELAGYQQILHWAVWPDPDLPRTSTGKPLRREVAAAVARMKESGAPAPEPRGALAGLIHRITGEDAGRVSDSALLAEDLHLDSLGRVELQSAIETQFGAVIDDAQFQQARTLGQLKELIQGSGEMPAPAHAPAPHLYPEWPWHGIARAARVLFQEAVMRPLVALLAAPRVVGALEEEPREPLLLVANHVTVYDVPLILFALPGPVRRRVAVAMAGEMLLDFRRARRQGNIALNLIGPLRYLLATALFNVFPLPQSGNYRASFAHAGRAMDRGFHVLVFPEGRRSPDGRMHAFQGGAGILWKELKCSALPIHLGGVGELKASGARWFRSGRIQVRVGHPLTLDPEADAASAAAQLERAVRELA